MVNIITYSNKTNIIENIMTQNGFSYKTFSGKHRGYSGWVNKEQTIIRFIRFRKFNKKSQQSYKIVDGRNITTSHVLRQPGWEVEYYDIPLSRVKSAFQFARDFSLELV